jgi:methylated-DNA-protein-cysteine methyltransferase-like protein
MQKEEDFFQQVWQVAQMIPHGKVTTYGAIANYLNKPNAARMVGWAMNKSFSSTQNIPAHRVVNRNGELTGKIYFGDPCLMEKLLKEEGVEVKNDKILNFHLYFWNPNNE